MSKFIIYTDGSANNKVPIEKRAAGYAALFFHKKRHKWEVFTGADGGLNSYEAEIAACILGLYMVIERNLTNKEILIISDNKSVVDAYKQNWIERWRSEKWAGRNKKAKMLDDIILNYNLKVSFSWVRGHNGDPANEKCDEEANKAREAFKRKNPKFK